MLLAAAGAETGPRMSEAELYDALDLTLPGLEPVAEAVDSGDMDAARTAFANYLRQRENVAWHFDWRRQASDEIPEQFELDDLSVYDRAMADAAMLHRFEMVGLEHQFADGIRWDYNPTEAEDSPIPANHEWTWVLNRQRHWVAMGKAYWETGDEAYAREFAEQMLNWVRVNPVLEDTGEAKAPRSRWRSIEAGIRMSETWPWAYHFFLSSPHFDAQALSVFLRSVCEHARYLREYNTDYNWLTLEMKGLYFVGALFPEFKEAADWRDYAAGRMREELDVQFYPDGMQTELSPSIHNRVLGTFSDIVDVARLNGYSLPAGYVEKLEPAYAVNLALVKPDRDVPKFQDCWRIDVPHMLARGLKYFPERDDFRWFATDGEKGAAPAWTSKRLPWSGYLVMRSDWGKNAQYLAFDAGPYGGKHQHEDKLNFVLAAYGRDLVVEAGSYAFDDSPWRRYVLDSYGHNVIIVDGMPQRRRFYVPFWNAEDEPLPCTWKVEDDYAYAEATFGGKFEKYRIARQEVAHHTRRILWLKNAPLPFYLVADTVASMDGQSHTYESYFHLDAPKVEIGGNGAVVTQYPDGPQLGIYTIMDEGLTVDIVEGQEEPYVQGWLPRGHGIPGIRPAPTARFTRTGGGTRHFVYAFVPTPEGTPPAVSLSADSANPLQIEVQFPETAPIHIDLSTYSSG
ncbi:MAG: alginate lyase family protein [Candidatus Hydrogenedentota bacterium]